jgi:anaerobic selenocysteine-containing dehydrogenase
MTDVIGACPLDCPDGCNWVVTVENGVATRLRGNPDHPFTAGALCAKVNGYLEHTRAPDRILYPLRRTGAKGEARFERISWDAALSEIAARRSGRSRARARSATSRASKAVPGSGCGTCSARRTTG